ncbi:MAG: hypothetical protein DRJ44_03885 [Thermoprotei archaeon]|nr:MAG: hypothetical protein DRJ44_03885 [Thermoprotei archaeon]
MAQKIQDSKFSQREVPLEPFLTFETIEEVVKKVLSHLMGWNDTDQRWMKIRVDSSGRLMTAAPGLATKHAINVISASDTETITTLAENYTSHIIYNDGPNAVYVNFDDTATTSSFKIPAGGSLSLDLEFKSLHTICAATETATVYWLALK